MHSNVSYLNRVRNSAISAGDGRHFLEIISGKINCVDVKSCREFSDCQTLQFCPTTPSIAGSLMHNGAESLRFIYFFIHDHDLLRMKNMELGC